MSAGVQEAENDRFKELTSDASQYSRKLSSEMDEIIQRKESIQAENTTLKRNLLKIEEEKASMVEEHRVAIQVLEQEKVIIQTSLQDAIAGLEQEKAESVNKLSEAAGVQDRMRYLERELEQLTQRSNQNEAAQVATLKEAEAFFQDKLRRMEQELAVARGLESELEMAQSLLHEASDNHDAVRSKLLKEIEYLQRELARKSEEMEHMQNKYISKDTENRQLKSDVEGLRSQTRRL